MSALDLFASALGAFILITVVLFPYFPNTGDSPERVAAVRAQLQQTQQQLQQTQQQLQQSQAENEALRKENTTFSLLGIATKEDTFVIIVDMSGSMDEYQETVYSTLVKILELFDDKKSIQIIGYQGDSDAPQIHNWQQPYNLATMTSANKRDAIDYIKRLTTEFDGSTPTGEALRQGMRYSAKAVLLLTDGAPNEAPNIIVDEITRLNQKQKEIHTIAIGKYNEDPVLTDFLRALSKANRGTFLGIAKY